MHFIEENIETRHLKAIPALTTTNQGRRSSPSRLARSYRTPGLTLDRLSILPSLQFGSNSTSKSLRPSRNLVVLARGIELLTIGRHNGALGKADRASVLHHLGVNAYRGWQSDGTEVGQVQGAGDAAGRKRTGGVVSTMIPRPSWRIGNDIRICGEQDGEDYRSELIFIMPLPY